MANLTDIFPAPTSNNIIEVIEGVADGRTVTINDNSYTFGNVTTHTSLSTSYADLPGSSITYAPRLIQNMFLINVILNFGELIMGVFRGIGLF